MLDCALELALNANTKTTHKNATTRIFLLTIASHSLRDLSKDTTATFVHSELNTNFNLETYSALFTAMPIAIDSTHRRPKEQQLDDFS